MESYAAPLKNRNRIPGGQWEKGLPPFVAELGDI